MTLDVRHAVRASSLPRVFGPIRPRPRWLEFRLLALVAVTLATGSLSLGATVTGRFVLSDATGLLVYLAALLAAHAAQVLAGRRTDQILLPTVAMLGGISLLLMQRLPQDLVTQTFFGTTLGLAQVQLGVAAAHRVEDLLDLPDEVDERPATRTERGTAPQ